MTRDEIVHLIDDLHKREMGKLAGYLGNMDSRGQISSKGNYHNGVATGLRLALNLVKTIHDPPPPAIHGNDLGKTRD